MTSTEIHHPEQKEDERFKREISGILDRFTTASEWADLSNLLERLKKTIKEYPKALIPVKKELAKRLSQCLSPRLPEVHTQALAVYREVFKRQKELSNRNSAFVLNGGENDQKPAVFGEDMALFISNLYNFYEGAGFEAKRAFLDLVEDHILSFEKELLTSLGAFLLCMVPALDDQNEDMVTKVHKILLKTEVIVGTSKLYGEIWKTMLRTPRAREMAIKYMDIKIPRDIDEAVALNNDERVDRQANKKQAIFLSKYDVVINGGKMIVVAIDYESGEELPEWAQLERQMHDFLSQAPADMQYESQFRKKLLNRQEKQARRTLIDAMSYFYYPNRQDLVINALLSGIHDLEHNLVVRATFDFLISHISIDSDFIGEKERVRLMEGALLTLTKRDFASQKKFFAWCFEHLDDNIDSEDPAILSCIEAYKNILKRFSNLKRPDDRGGSSIQSRMQQGKDESNFSIQHPIKILQTVFQDDDMNDVVQAILKEITQHLIKYIYNLYSDPSLNENELNKLKNEVNNLFEHIDQHQSIVWTSLGSLLRDQIEQIKHGQSDSEIEAIDLIICCLDKLCPQTEEARQKRDQRNGGLNKDSKKENRLIQNTLAEITSILLKNFQTLTNNYSQLHSAIPALKLLSMMLQNMQQAWSQKEQVTNKRHQTANALEQGVSQFNDFYARLIRQIQDRDRLQSNNPDLETLRQASAILCEIQMYANPTSFEFKPQWMLKEQERGQNRNWLEQVGDCALQGRNQTAQLVAVDVLIRIIKQEVNEDFGTRAKQNIKALQQLISPFEEHLSAALNDDNISDSNFADFDLDNGEIIGSSLNELYAAPPAKKRQLSINFGDDLDQISDTDDSIIRADGLENLQSDTDLIPKVIGKLWSLLGQKGDHVQIVQLLKQFDRVKPEIFSDVIMEDLGNEDRDVKRRAVEKFATFWKIATDRKQKSLDNIKYIPFQPLSERKEKNEANMTVIIGAGNQKHSDRRDYDALHKILMILEDRDPTLRLATRSWLQDSSQDFSRIIDPILKEFMRNNKMFRSYTGQLFYTEEYNAEYVKENFTKLRNIILMTQEDFVKYICLNKCSDDIEEEFAEVVKIMEGPTVVQSQPLVRQNRTAELEKTYIFGIVNLTLQFIMGQYVNVLSAKRHQETEIVNASACEFMELLIRSISQIQNICTDIIHLIIGRLVKTLRVAIDSRNDAQQVILLNLLKVILFEHEKLFYSDSFRQNDRDHYLGAKNLFETTSFFSCFTDGLRSEGAFVRYHYILFAQKLVPLMHKVLESDQLVGHVNKIIDCFCSLLKTADVSAYESNKRAGKIIIQNDKLDEEDESLPADRPAALQRDPYKPFIEITQENEVLQLIKGFKTILNHCLGILTAEDEAAALQQERLQSLGQVDDRQSGLMGWLFGPRTIVNEDANRQLKEAVAEKSDMILTACLSCFNDLDVFRAREFFFTSLGMFGFNEDDRSTIEKKVRDGVGLDWFAQRSESTEQKFQRYLKDQCNPIQWKLINLLKPIANNHSPRIMEAFLSIWLKTMQPVRDPTVLEHTDSQSVDKIQKLQAMKAQKLRQSSQECEKVLQMILSLQLPAHSVIAAVNALIENKQWKQKERSGMLTMNMEQKDIAERESSLCQFVYSYLMHNLQFVNLKLGEGAEDFAKAKEDLYKETIDFVLNFRWTRHPITTCWLIEILHILTNKFIAPASMSKSSLQEKLEKLLTFLLENAACIISDESKLDFNANEYCLFDLHLSPTVYEMLKRFEFIQMKNQDINGVDRVSETEESQIILQQQIVQRYEEGTGDEDPARASNRNYNLLFSKTQLTAYEKLPVFRESICEELERDWRESVNAHSSKELESGEFGKVIMDEYAKSKFIYEYINDIREKVHNRKPSYGLQEVFRTFTVVTLRQVLTQVTAKVHSTGQDQGQMQKRRKAESVIVNTVMNLIQKQIESGSPSHSLHNFDEVNFEMLTELLRSVTVVQHQVQTHYKNQIEAIFTAKNFFEMNERSLRKWQMIMQQYTMTNSDLWTDLLRNFDSQGGFFRGNDERMARQSEIFRQLSFLIFSTKMDQIGDRDMLDPLLKKMVDSFKASDKAESFIKSLFLLSRIIMLRLSKRKLTEATKKFWPHLQAELVAVFDDPQQSIGQNVKKEAIKVVELMSQLNLDEFQINQWMFMFDGFGIKYRNDNESAPGQPSYARVSTRDQVFQPYLVQFMQEGHFDVYNSAQGENSGEGQEDDDFKEIVPCKANKPLFTEFAQIEVQKYAIDLQSKLEASNTTSMRLDKAAADALIEKDFHTSNSRDEELAKQGNQAKRAN